MPSSSDDWITAAAEGTLTELNKMGLLKIPFHAATVTTRIMLVEKIIRTAYDKAHPHRRCIRCGSPLSCVACDDILLFGKTKRGWLEVECFARIHGWDLHKPTHTAGGNAAFMEFSKPDGESAAFTRGVRLGSTFASWEADSPAPVCGTPHSGQLGFMPWRCKLHKGHKGACSPQPETISAPPQQDKPVDVGACLIRMHIRAKEACSTGGAIANEQGDYEYVKRQFRRLAAERDEAVREATQEQVNHGFWRSSAERADRAERELKGRTISLDEANNALTDAERRLERVSAIVRDMNRPCACMLCIAHAKALKEVSDDAE